MYDVQASIILRLANRGLKHTQIQTEFPGNAFHKTPKLALSNAGQDELPSPHYVQPSTSVIQ